jgi:hypothetical protein
MRRIPRDCRHAFTPRDAKRPSHARNFPPFGKQRARGMPGAQCTRSLVRARVVEYAHEYSQRRHRKHPAFPTQWFERLIARSCDEFLLATVASRIEWLHVPGWAAKTSARLSISNGCQDHTTSPYASAPFVLRVCRSLTGFHPPCDPVSRATLPRPPHPVPTFVTTAKRPSCGTGWR